MARSDEEKAASIFSEVGQRCPQRAVFAEGLSNPGLACLHGTQAVVLAPNKNEPIRRRYATLSVSHLGPWVETHGYLHSVATRLGTAARASIFFKVGQRCPQRAVFRPASGGAISCLAETAFTLRVFG